MRVINFSTTDSLSKIYNENYIKRGENLASELQITLTDEYLGYNYSILFKVNDNTPISTAEIVPIDNVLSYTITNAITNFSGQLKLEIQCINNTGTIVKSLVYTLPITSSLEEDNAVIMPEQYVPWYVDALNKSVEASNSADIAIANAVIADQKADETSVSAGEALISAQNALVSEGKAKTSELNALESENNASDSEAITVQAMTDYLAMVGVDIATLVNGKIPMSQIPATATNDNITITDESQLVTITAQIGDIANFIQEVDGKMTVVKAYKLLGTGVSTVLENWILMGTSYALQAGNATTATNANDSAMINGHRLVEMTFAEYELAVKDADTYYILH